MCESINIKISASSVAHLRFNSNMDKSRTIIERTLKMNDPDGYEKHSRWKQHLNENVYMDTVGTMDILDAKHHIHMTNYHRGTSVVREIQKDFLDRRMQAFGHEEESKSADGVRRLLALKKWTLTKFQGDENYVKEYPCEILGARVNLIISGRLDGECRHRNTNAVVEIKNRINGLIYNPRQTEECQVRIYMDITGYDHAFLFERHMSSIGGEMLSVFPFEVKPGYVNDILQHKTFKHNLEIIFRCLSNEREFEKFFR